jgi:hypothetical protein
MPGTRDLHAPVAYVQTPVTGKPKSTCKAILGFYGADTKNMDLPDLVRQVAASIRDHGTKALLLDDITRLRMHRADDQDVLDLIRAFMSMHVTLVLIGVAGHHQPAPSDKRAVPARAQRLQAPVRLRGRLGTRHQGEHLMAPRIIENQLAAGDPTWHRRRDSMWHFYNASPVKPHYAALRKILSAHADALSPPLAPGSRPRSMAPQPTPDKPGKRHLSLGDTNKQLNRHGRRQVGGRTGEDVVSAQPCCHPESLDARSRVRGSCHFPRSWPVGGRQQQSSPRQDWMPSRTATAAMPRPMAGSSHQAAGQAAVTASASSTAAAWAAHR